MTKKDYIKLAQALKDSRPSMLQHGPNYYNGVIQTWNEVVEHLAATLQFDNPQFNRARFLHACGYTQE